MTAFDTAATTLAADLNLGVDATLDGAPVRVVLTRIEGDALAMLPGVTAAGWEAMLPASAVPDRPARGAALVTTVETFTVETAELDTTGASWRLTLRIA